MIKIELSLALAIYLILTVCVLLILWMGFEKSEILKTLSSEKRFFWQCTICTYVYVDSKHNTLSRCPRCGSFNKKEDTHA